jgi:DnaJ-domain-containing protein 1
MRHCEHPGCNQEGEFPAPKSRDTLREYHYFCLDHVREYNKGWDFFKGYTEEQIYDQMRKDVSWERPTWTGNIPLKLEERLHAFIRQWTNDNKEYKKAASQVLSKEAQALQTLGLSPSADTKTIKAKYRELVKRYHPDKNPDNPKAAERFKVIAEAYAILQNKA